MTLVNCRYETLMSGAVCDDDCKVVTRAEAKLDAATYRPLAGSKLIDDASKEIYDAQFPERFRDDLAGYDFGLSARVKGRTIDIGAGEFDWTASVAAALSSDDRFTATSIPASAYVDGEGKVVLAAGTTVAGAWTTPSGAIVSNAYSLTAVASGSAVLSVYLDGAATPILQLTAADGEKTLDYSAMQHTVTLAVTGADGTVALSPLATDAPTAWFVKADGDDTADGKTLATAKATISEALALASAGSVVYVGPGVYSKGLMVNSFKNPNDETVYASNRVVVAKDVELVGYRGAGETVIEGYRSKQNASGCGPDAVRGAYVMEGGVLRGFTIRNGATQAERTSKYTWEEVINGGGVVTFGNAAVVDCVISNNVAGYRGGGVGSQSAGYGGYYIRCLIGTNEAVDTGVPGGQYGNYFNCVFDGPGAKVYASGAKVVNCTFRGGANVQGNAQNKVFNSIVGDGGKGDFYRCVSTASGPSYNSTHSDDPVFGMYDICDTLDAAWRPTTKSVLVGRGDANHYVTNFPSAWTRFADLDFAGGPRFSKGLIDIGAGERNRPQNGCMILIR